MRCIAIISLAVLLSKLACAQQSSDSFEKWAAEQAISLRTIEAEGDSQDLVPLKSLVGSAHVVAIGEPNHGTHEPLALRNRLIRFLVEDMGFTAVALETSFTESFAVERFVTGGPGELHNTVSNFITWGFGNFPENHELIQWIRDYNADSAHHNKVHFYGIDLSGAQDGAFPEARRAVDFPIALLARANPASAERIRQQIEPVLKRFSTCAFSSLSPTEHEQLLAGFKETAGALEREKSALVSATSDEEYEWALHSIVLARQLDQMFAVSPTKPWPGPGIPPDVDRMCAARDSGMAENVRWALDREKPSGRLVVFAHNGHIMNSPLTGGIWSAFRQPPSPMGKLLRPVFKDDLVIIGGSSGAAPAGKSLKADPNNVDAVLAHLGIPWFILDLRPARNEPAAFAWLSAPRSLNANIETFVTIEPSDAFDALYFVDKLTGTRARKP